MLDGLTQAKASELNALRRVFGPAGDLVLLRFEGRDAGPAFSSLKIYSENESTNGWGVDSATGDDAADRVKPQIADVDGELATIADPQSSEATHFWLLGKVYKLEPDQTRRPIKAPFVWTLRGYVTSETWTP
jgi:hypothetical protein